MNFFNDKHIFDQKRVETTSVKAEIAIGILTGSGIVKYCRSRSYEQTD